MVDTKDKKIVDIFNTSVLIIDICHHHCHRPGGLLNGTTDSLYHQLILSLELLHNL
jgi:hypothetical protein